MLLVLKKLRVRGSHGRVLEVVLGAVQKLGLDQILMQLLDPMIV